MKKFICLMMVMLFLLTIPIIAFATDTDTHKKEAPAWKMWDDICKNSNEQYHAQLALNVTYDEPTGRIIVAGQPSALVQQYLQNIPTYQQKYPSVQCEVHMVVDFQFNDQPWYSEYIESSMQLSEIFTHTYTLTASESDGFVFSLCDIQKYTPESDMNNVLTNIVEYQDGTPYIDFNKHTLRAKVKILFVFDSPEVFLEAEDSNDVISVYHNQELDVEVTMPYLQVQNAIYHTQNHKTFITITPSAEINSLLLMGHNVELQASYRIGDEWSKAYTAPAQYQASTYIFDIPPINHTTDEPVMFKLQWHDSSTNSTSEETVIMAELKHTSEPGEDDAHTHKSVCSVCKKCNTPANVCLWIWISAGIALAISVISFTTFIIISVHKKPNTNKENVHA